MTIVSDADNNLLRNLREISSTQKISATLANHIEHYFADTDLASFGEASPEELLGAAPQLPRLASLRTPGQASIAIYTPDFDRHGWHSPHTVIDIATDDMPFLVDSVTMVVYRHGLAIHRLMHPLLGIKRAASGALELSAKRGTEGTQTESWIHLEIDRISDAQQLEALRTEIADALADVRAAVEDFGTMREKTATAIADLDLSARDENGGLAVFLCWMAGE